jgi:hypothetical protein
MAREGGDVVLAVKRPHEDVASGGVGEGMEDAVRLVACEMIYNHLVVAKHTAADRCKVSFRTVSMSTVRADPALERGGKRQWVRIVESTLIDEPRAPLTGRIRGCCT